MSYKTMNYAWKKLWPECVPDRDLDGFEADSYSAKHSPRNDDYTFFDGIDYRTKYGIEGRR